MLRVLAVNDVYTLRNLARLRGLFDTHGGAAAGWRAVRRKRKSSGLEILASRDAWNGDDVVERQEQGAEDKVVLCTLAGDFLSPNVLSPIDSGFSFMKCYNRLGIDRFCFGNHERSLHIVQLQERLEECEGVLLNTNVPSFDRPKLLPFDVIEVGPWRVGLLGLLSNDRAVFPKQTFKGFRILDVVETARRWERVLRREKNCDYVLALTHQSLADDRALAEQTGLDAIIGGHDHVPFHETVNGCRIVKSGKDAEACGILDLDLATGAMSYQLEETADYKADEEMTALVDGCMDLVEQLQQETMISEGQMLTATGTRFRQTDLGRVICSYVRAELGTDVAMINGASIKTSVDYEDGVLSLAELQNVLPFPTKMVTVAMPGAVLEAAIQFSRSSRSWDEEKRGFLQVDGGVLVENATVSGPFGEDCPEGPSDVVVEVAGEPFDTAKTYVVALPRNLLKGFCEIEPLVTFGKQQAQLPDDDNFFVASDLVVRHCCKKIWENLGEWEDIDKNNDDLVSRAELRDRLVQVFGRVPSELVLDGLLAALDFNQDSCIDRGEFDRFKRKL